MIGAKKRQPTSPLHDSTPPGEDKPSFRTHNQKANQVQKRLQLWTIRPIAEDPCACNKGQRGMQK